MYNTGIPDLNTMSNVVYFNQILGAAHNQKLVETLFLPFSTFLVHFKQKRLKTAEYKYCDQLSGAHSTRKLVKIRNRARQNNFELITK